MRLNLQVKTTLPLDRCNWDLVCGLFCRFCPSLFFVDMGWKYLVSVAGDYLRRRHIFNVIYSRTKKEGLK